MDEARIDPVAFNRAAWDRAVAEGDEWTTPVSPGTIAAARRGEWAIFLSERIPADRTWFPADLVGVDVLCLASGGGQQGPILAAAGANVTVFDNSPRQLAQDRMVADREGLALRTVQGDMADLSVFPDASFDLIVNPASVLFVADVRPVWREAYRVLRPGGALLAGFLNPVEYIFDRKLMDDEERMVVRFALPYADLTDLSPAEREALYGPDAPLEFSHTLTDLIGGQLAAGFLLADLGEDYRRSGVVARHMPSYIVTRAVKR